LQQNARDEKEATPLMLAAEVENGSCAELLVGCKGVDLNAQDGKSALHIAAEREGDEVLSLLVATKVVNVNLKDRFGNTTLHYAVKRG
jgi:ankyrin repeat protein